MSPQLYNHDKSTIVSIVPSAVREFKPGLYPGNFNIEPCMDDKKPQMYVVGASFHLMTIGGRKDPIRIVTPSYEIASSVVRDFIDGQLWIVPGVACPGITWIAGEVTCKEFLTVHKDKYTSLIEQQRNWFVNLIKQTDNQWNKERNYRVVSDQARFAARYLGLEPEWTKSEEVGLSYKKCSSCATPNDPNNILCTNCRFVLDRSRYNKEDYAA